MKEEWKNIPGYEGLYEVSTLGRIRSLDKNIDTYNGGSYVRKGAIKKLRINKSGYYCVNLCKNGISVSHIAHRLVAKAFIENKNNYPEVNHINENRLDNRVENLEWCSHKQNVNWGHHNIRAAITNGRPVKQFTIDGKYIREYYSSHEAQRNTGIVEQSINLCCLGRRQQAGGFRWKYADDLTAFEPYRSRRSSVIQYKDGKVVNKFSSIQEAYSATGINNISACCRGAIKSSGGYEWRYAK